MNIDRSPLTVRNVRADSVQCCSSPPLWWIIYKIRVYPLLSHTTDSKINRSLFAMQLCAFFYDALFRFSLTNEQTRSLLSIMPKMLQPSYETPSNAPPTRLHALQCPYPTNIVCEPHAKYRTYDGRCNNLQRPLWGSSHQPLVRFVPPNYADGECE